MPKKLKKFLDKKNSVTFHLVHRSQQDPLAADDTAPQRVLLPQTLKRDPADKKRIEEQHEYGVFFDDDYNYLQHLREANTTAEWVEAPKETQNHQPKLKLPSSVFASIVEEDVGLLNKAAPQSGLRLDLDPDVVAAMDDDFNFEDPDNELEDNFMELADAEGSDDEDMDSEDGSNYGSEEMDNVGSLHGSQFSFEDVETKSRFTDYSMSSSMIRRNDQLTLLDNKFEQMYADYDENEIGALDCDEIEGHVEESDSILLQYADEFEKQRRREQIDKEAIAKRVLEEDSDGNGEEFVDMEVKEKKKWDCESILSTYSNIYNHPKLIVEPKQSKIKINKRTGLPVNVLGTNKLTSKALSQLDEQNAYNEKKYGSKSIGAQSIISTLSTLSVRPKDESPPQRRERKQLLRDYRRERRQEKKLNSEAFKEEKKRQVKININNRNNIQGNTIV